MPTQNPIEPQVQRSGITNPTEIQSSGGQRGDHVNNLTAIRASSGKRKQSDQSKDGTVCKYCRFEFEHENIENE